MTPAGKMPVLSGELQQSNISGVSCHDQTRPKYASNLWKTELLHDGKVLYSGLRHGVNCAYKIKDNATRIEANKQRAKDLFKAALVRNPKLLESAKNGELVDLPMVSLSLLSPDRIRITSVFADSDQERKMLREQTAAWRDACDQNGVCQMTITDDDGKEFNIKVRPQVLTFNYAVNKLGQDSFLKHIMSGWGVSEDMNKTALTTLIGDPHGNGIGGLVGDYYAKCDDPVKKEKIETLVNQIKNLHNSGDYKTAGEDPYRLPARINLLAYLCDLTPCFNCKSGKDRTGQMDVSTKELALSQISIRLKPRPFTGRFYFNLDFEYNVLSFPETPVL